MVSKNNQWQHLRASAQRVPHYGLRKLSVGVASVLLSTTLYMGVSAHADTVTTPGEATTPATTTVTNSNSGTTETASQGTGSGVNAASTNEASETPTSQVAPTNSVNMPKEAADNAADAKLDNGIPRGGNQRQHQQKR